MSMDDCNWWERGRWNYLDTDESIWRNTNMIWIVGIAPWVIGLPLALLYQFFFGGCR